MRFEASADNGEDHGRHSEGTFNAFSFQGLYFTRNDKFGNDCQEDCLQFIVIVLCDVFMNEHEIKVFPEFTHHRFNSW